MMVCLLLLSAHTGQVRLMYIYIIHTPQYYRDVIIHYDFEFEMTYVFKNYAKSAEQNYLSSQREEITYDEQQKKGH